MQRVVHFGLMDAYRLGIGYIKRRLQRTVINVVSVALAISFFANLSFSELFYQTYTTIDGGPISVNAYQYWLVGIALIVSVVGITNAMLIAVYERTKEIGTMKCIGALDRHIVMLFLVEAVIQGAFGGFIGCLIGGGSAIVSTGFQIGFNVIQNVGQLVLLEYVIGTTMLGITICILASIYPSWRASKLPPVEALRYEL